MEHALIYPRNHPRPNVNVLPHSLVFNVNILMHRVHRSHVKIWVLVCREIRSTVVIVRMDLQESIVRKIFMFARVIPVKMEANVLNPRRTITSVSAHGHSMESIAN